MGPIRSALYLDFDNVFSGLLKLDPSVALSFAESPGTWLSRLAQHDGVARRWLVVRCYMNPAGVVTDPRGEGVRLYFSRFRPNFTDAGFEVVDCPRLSHTKNGADIRLVIDAVEALRADARYDEFVIASGDSDMTPLMVRLRAADRGVTLVSPSDSAVAMQSVADRLIGGDDLLELVDTRSEVLDQGIEGDPDEVLPPDGEADGGLTDAEGWTRFVGIVSERYDSATEPIVLATLAHDLHADLGAVAKTSRWFGHEGFGKALRAVDLPGARLSQQHVWDSRRHTPPEADAAVLRVAALLKIPMLPPESWNGIYESLARFLDEHEFTLSEATRWSRDRLVESGVRVNRPAVGLVARGAAFGGTPLYAEPPPSAHSIGEAFVTNLLGRVAAADVDLSSEETTAVRQWFGPTGASD